MNDIRIRAEALLDEASKAIDARTNGLYDRGDLVELISTFVPLVQELMEASQRERQDMTRRLRRSPFRFAQSLKTFAERPSV
jgi:hypothetical protein